ncbi:MAG: aspartate-semialdehyde dehydrogenase [Clostridiales bacterium]|jgi:aspartate-semialdehyde dehydrogenase|nr:aspartate-semialdehyde dehydrogenase [Clostridiales bacterium]
MKKYNVAIVGATGMVGRKFLKVLEERRLPIGGYYLFASKNSAGQTVEFMGKPYTVVELTRENILGKNLHYALFSAGAGVSREFAPVFAQNGIAVIDNSSCWRMDPAVPLVVPEVNPKDLDWHKGIVANPNCSTIQAVVALAPLHKKFKLKRVVYSTYQAVSGAGQQGYADLSEGAKGNPPKKFPKPIFGNALPQIDVFCPDGYTKEEHKMMDETRKILGLPDLKVTATAVRVPVFHGHSESINAEFKRPATVESIRGVLSKAPGVVLLDDPANGAYPTPLEAEDRDEVFIGRVRADDSVKYGANLWVVADNIRKGAATNAVQILQLLIKKDGKQKK